MARRRADVLVVEQGLADSRTRAQALILAGAVLAGDKPVKKPGDQLSEEVVLRLRGEKLPYVSRAGLKLAGALDEFGVDVTGAVCLDVGQSTGGFTDCLLQYGAARVYGVDVGYGQLAWKIREDPRVVVIERKNIRTMEPDNVPEPCGVLVIDVSFISLELVLPPALPFLTHDAWIVALIKPQFEVGREQVGKGGIVRDASARAGAVEKIERLFAVQGIDVSPVIPSPIRGTKGNEEFLICGRRG